MANFTSNPSALLGQFGTYLQQHGSFGNITQNGGASQTNAYANIATNPSALLGHFGSFLQHLGKSEKSPLVSSNRDKLDSQAVKCAFIGYSTTQKGYKCYGVKARRVLISCDVKFDESKSFFEKTSENNPQREQLSDSIPLPLIETYFFPCSSNDIPDEDFFPEHNDEHRVESPNGVQTEINGESEVTVITAP
ncbi:unnamed protein product, partial [Prunus brigantina]